MPQACVYVLASLISGVSAAALILASSPSYTEARSPQGTAYNVKWGQSAYNECRASPCQVAYLNSAEDFCLWAPPQPALSAARNTEHTLVAWCMKSAQETRLIPDGTISGARLVITPEYVQITGVGNLSNINVPADGVASASGEGDGVHGFVFTRAYGQLEQIYDWTSFVSQERFCFRACKPSVAASTACPRIRDISGCSENVLGSYETGVFEDCIGAIEVPSILYQEIPATPSHHSAPRPSSCVTRGTIGNAQFARARRAIASMSGSASSALVTSFSYWHSRSHRHSTPLTSSTTTTTTDTATTITFPSFPTSATPDTATTITLPSSPTSTTDPAATPTLTATTFMNSSVPVSSVIPTSTLYSYNTHSHWHSHTHWRSRHHSSSSLGELSSTSSAWSPTSSTPSFTLTISTYSSSDPASSGTSTSSATFTSTSTSTLTSTPAPAPTPTSTPTPTSSFPSSYETSSSLSEPSSSQPSLYQSSTPLSTATPTSPPASPPTSSSTPSQTSDVLTFATTTSSSSVPTTSPATPSSTLPNSQTQIGSQCPPSSQVSKGRHVLHSSLPSLPLMLTILMSVISSSIGVLVP